MIFIFSPKSTWKNVIELICLECFCNVRERELSYVHDMRAFFKHVQCWCSDIMTKGLILATICDLYFVDCGFYLVFFFSKYFSVGLYLLSLLFILQSSDNQPLNLPSFYSNKDLSFLGCRDRSLHNLYSVNTTKCGQHNSPHLRCIRHR